MENLKQTITSYSCKNLEVRKNWYSPAAEAYNKARPHYPPPAAEAYNKARPHYPQKLIEQVVKIAQLSTNSKILEIGCGPATATTSFAQLGYSMICLEPNPDFFKLAQHNCQPYPNVEIKNTSFEEWTQDFNNFDAVLAASSFHWISPEVGYLKAANALKKDGYLILLWNKELQPSYEIYQSLSEVYQIHAPSLDRYEDKETQQKILKELGSMIIDSGQFKDLKFGQV